MKKLIILCLFLSTSCFAQENNNDWKARLYQAEKEFKQVKLEVDIMYRMVSELYIRRFGMEKYENLIWSEKKDEGQKP